MRSRDSNANEAEYKLRLYELISLIGRQTVLPAAATCFYANIQTNKLYNVKLGSKKASASEDETQSLRADACLASAHLVTVAH